MVELPADQRAETIVREYGGLYALHEAFYIEAITYAAERALNAFQEYQSSLYQNTKPAQVMALMQEALTHAAALSRFFWPTKKDNLLAEARGKLLRVAFSVADKSPLKWRRLRNAFEHFDEDLDKFLLDLPVGPIFPSPIVGDYREYGSDINHFFKFIDPNNGLCFILGEKYEYRPIFQEVARVFSMAREMEQSGYRLQKPNRRLFKSP